MRANAKFATGALATFMTLALLGSMATPGAGLITSAAGAQGHAALAPMHGLQEPAGPQSNQIDTSSKAAVQRAYLDRYQKNMVRVAQGEGADLDQCQPGQPIPAGIAPTIESWNFLRGLNGLNAVSADIDSPATKYAMAAAMVSARNGKLSHYPAESGFECATEDAVRGARHSNLAQSLSQTAAETALWYYMDYSTAKDPINDQLGHRLFMMDPQLSSTAMGAVKGYTAISVRTGEDYPGLPADTMRDATAPTPEWMSWPSAGFFPKQLLTSVGQTAEGEDVERWSFSVRGADLSNVKVSITDPNGNEVSATVIRPGQPGVAYTPRSIADYSTVLMKLPTIKDLPVDQQNKVYTVNVSGVRGASQSDYSYRVILFDPMTPLGPAAPQVQLDKQPLTGVGYKMTNPIKMNVSAWPQPALQWQQRVNGGEWEDIAGANFDSYLPEGQWDMNRALSTEYRLTAANIEGEGASEPVRVAVQGLSSMPGNIDLKIGETATWKAQALVDQDGKQFDTTYEWQMLNGGKWETIPENGHFTGTNTPELSVHNVTALDRGLTVRLVVRSKVFKISGYDVIVVWTDGKATLNVS